MLCPNCKQEELEILYNEDGTIAEYFCNSCLTSFEPGEIEDNKSKDSEE